MCPCPISNMGTLHITDSPRHPMPRRLQMGLRGGMGWVKGWGNPLRIYFHIGYSILDI